MEGVYTHGALADNDERVLGGLEELDGVGNFGRVGQRLRRRRALGHERDGLSGGLAHADVGGQVDVGGAGAAVGAHADGDLEEVGDALDGVRPRGVLAERLGRRDLRRLLEGTHRLLLRERGAAEEDHGPAVGPGVREAGDAVDLAGARDGQARAGHTRQEAHARRGVGSCLLIAKAVWRQQRGRRGERERGAGTRQAVRSGGGCAQYLPPMAWKAAAMPCAHTERAQDGASPKTRSAKSSW